MLQLVVFTRAGSVLTETEEPTVLGRFFETETVIEPNFVNFGNRERTETEHSKSRVPEIGQNRPKIRKFDEFQSIFSVKLIEIHQNRAILMNFAKKLIEI